MRRPAQGFTILELAVVLTITALAWSMVQPGFRRVVERSRRDAARDQLVSIWRAERVYWARHALFAQSLDALVAEGLLEPRLTKPDPAAPFRYEVVSSDQASFEARAVRQASAMNEGEMVIDQSGALVDDLYPAI